MHQVAGLLATYGEINPKCNVAQMKVWAEQTGSKQDVQMTKVIQIMITQIIEVY